MKVKVRALLTDIVEHGIELGYSRAHKHTNEPSEHIMKENIERAIWERIDDFFKFEEEFE